VTAETLSTLESRFVGALLGTMVGDQLGAPFEGQPAEAIPDLQGGPEEDSAYWIGASRYTDDTQMMIALAESLVIMGRADGADIARRFSDNYEPQRGYGSGAHQALSALRHGCQWDQAAKLVFPDGSFGNGAAMRVAPVGVHYFDDTVELRRAAELSAVITHAHPLGMEGAVLQARAVAEAMGIAGAPVDPAAFLGVLQTFVRNDCDDYIRSMERIALLLTDHPTVADVVGALGNDIRAHRSVPAAIYAFLSHTESFASAVRYAVMLGGDTDTIGAMTGAIAGAYHSAGGIPSSWLDALENSEKGRDYVRVLASRLYKRYVARHSTA
jgi:poly(ADP-ribose) glycohydrolase ARH3